MPILSAAGFLDTHVHTGPAPFRRLGDTIDIAGWCRAADMSGIVVEKPFRGDHRQGLPRAEGLPRLPRVRRHRAEPGRRRHQSPGRRTSPETGRAIRLDADHRRRQPRARLRCRRGVRRHRRWQLFRKQRARAGRRACIPSSTAASCRRKPRMSSTSSSSTTRSSPPGTFPRRKSTLSSTTGSAGSSPKSSSPTPRCSAPTWTSRPRSNWPDRGA